MAELPTLSEFPLHLGPSARKQAEDRAAVRATKEAKRAAQAENRAAVRAAKETKRAAQAKERAAVRAAREAKQAAKQQEGVTWEEHCARVSASAAQIKLSPAARIKHAEDLYRLAVKRVGNTKTALKAAEEARTTAKENLKQAREAFGSSIQAPTPRATSRRNRKES